MNTKIFDHYTMQKGIVRSDSTKLKIVSLTC